MIVADVLPVDNVNSPMRTRALNARVMAAVNSYVSYTVMHTVCRVGIILFKRSNVIGKRVSLCSVVLCMP